MNEAHSLSLERYIESSTYIDWKHPVVRRKAEELAAGCSSQTELAPRCFAFVRDSIKHSWDWQMNPVTCKASEVLEHGTGYCYAKSHLLAALLRANHIPAGLCYQRLVTETGGRSHCIHGLNAVHLDDVGWYRIDARGNKEGVLADFCPPLERLAFPIVNPGETDIVGIWPEPLPVVIEALTENVTIQDVFENLPDMEFERCRAMRGPTPASQMEARLTSA